MLFQIGAAAPGTLEKRKPALTAFLRAIARAQELIAKHPDQAAELARKAFPKIDPDVLKAAFTAASPSFLPNPSIPTAGLEKAIAFSPLAGKTSAADVTDEGLAHDAMAPGSTGAK
jgi:ABC-type nitrate/sulfonate/bicarbonate transport system substrate-binding protein